MEQHFARPADAFEMAVRVRSYEVTRSGQITAATVLRYMEYCATQASASLGFGSDWYEQNDTAWVVRDISLVFGSLPAQGKELAISTWISSNRRVQAIREYVIAFEDSGGLVARGQARWAYVDRLRGSPVRIPDHMLQRFGSLGHAMDGNDWHLTDGLETSTEPVVTHTMEVTAREYETDSQQHVNNCAYLDWLQEALRLAANTMPGQRAQRIRPVAFRLTYLRPSMPDERFLVVTRLYEGAHHELLCSQTIQSSDQDRRVVALSRHSASAE